MLFAGDQISEKMRKNDQNFGTNNVENTDPKFEMEKIIKPLEKRKKRLVSVSLVNSLLFGEISRKFNKLKSQLTGVH